MTHVAVLYGGLSAEREVSLTSGKAVEAALNSLGYGVTMIDVAADVAEQLQAAGADVAFNALHGRWGEDGCMQGVLEILKIPYTHSGVLASALAMDKPMAKRLFADVGLPCAPGKLCSKTEMLAGDPMERPYVVKPSNEGSSVGVQLVFAEDNFFFTAENWPHGEEVLVEEYIPGREIQVAVLDGKALGAIEIRADGKFYDYEAKYTDGKAQHLMPAPLETAQYSEVCAMAEQAHAVLGCRGLTRSDFRLSEAGKWYIVEVNTQPGMTPLSLAPEIAAHVGISFEELVKRLVEGAQLG